MFLLAENRLSNMVLPIGQIHVGFAYTAVLYKRWLVFNVAPSKLLINWIACRIGLNYQIAITGLPMGIAWETKY